MKQFLSILCLLLLSASHSSPALAKQHDPPVDSSRVTKPDNHIVPYQRIGAIRLGMGMDEVQSILGNPFNWTERPYVGASKAMSNAAMWNYPGLNLYVSFGGGVAPKVTGVSTNTWPHKHITYGNTYRKDLDPVKVTFQTNEGITIGSSTFDVIRAYGDQFRDPGGYGISMDYGSLGLYFQITMDHIVYGIGIHEPQ